MMNKRNSRYLRHTNSSSHGMYVRYERINNNDNDRTINTYGRLCVDEHEQLIYPSLAVSTQQQQKQLRPIPRRNSAYARPKYQ